MSALMSHTDLQQATVELLSLTGWSHLHVRRSIGRGKQWVTATNLKGWPDLWCWSPRQPGRWLAIEIKVPPDWLSDDQAAVLAALASAGAEALVLTEKPGTLLPLPHGVALADLFEELPRLLRPPRGIHSSTASSPLPSRSQPRKGPRS